MRYSVEQYAALYDQVLEGTGSGDHRSMAERLGHWEVGPRYCTKRIVAGNYLEWECYPVWLRRETATRAKKAKPTVAAQQRLNWANARKWVVRLLNANFTDADLFITLSYRGRPPATVKEAKRDMAAYIRRVRRWRKKHSLSDAKYIYTVETENDGRKVRVHHHIVMSGMDRDEAERLWAMGRANANRLQADEYGYEGLARYFAKSQQASSRERGERLWVCSRNLKRPKPTRSYSKLSRGTVARGAADEAQLRATIARWEPDYIINDITIRTSDYVPGAYVHIRMRRNPVTKKQQTTGQYSRGNTGREDHEQLLRRLAAGERRPGQADGQHPDGRWTHPHL